MQRMDSYASAEPDNRNGQKTFNFELFKEFSFDPFSDTERRVLDEATDEYHRRIQGQTTLIHEKELER